MNYKQIYQKLIISRLKLKKLRTIEKNQKIQYYEKHHILPKSLNGTENKDNLVLLTAKEHFLAHRLLCEIYPKNNKLKFAFWAMCNQTFGDVKREYKISSKTYQRAKEEFILINSLRHKGKKWSKEHREKYKEYCKNNPSPMKGKTGILNHLFKIPRTKKVIEKITKTKLDHPERNCAFKGYYLTPFGKFASVNQIRTFLLKKYKIDLKLCVLWARCKKFDKPINYYQNPKTNHVYDLRLLHPTLKNYSNKTFKELGWDFESLSLK